MAQIPDKPLDRPRPRSERPTYGAVVVREESRESGDSAVSSDGDEEGLPPFKTTGPRPRRLSTYQETSQS